MKPLHFYSPSNRLISSCHSQNGFTLIEVIVSMLIIGIVSVFMSAGIARVVEGYMFSKDNADTALKSQVALSRLGKEIRSIDGINTGTRTSVTYSFNKGGTSIAGRIVSWSGTPGDSLMLGSNALVDNVNDFEITYHDDYTDAGDNTWGGTEKLIGITLTLNGASGQDSSFSIRIAPRNL